MKNKLILLLTFLCPLLFMSISAFGQKVSSTSINCISVYDNSDKYKGLNFKVVVTKAADGAQYSCIIPPTVSFEICFPQTQEQQILFKDHAGNPPYASPGKYTWKCYVGGKIIVDGSFTLESPNVDLKFHN